jgi:hypothetical protein
MGKGNKVPYGAFNSRLRKALNTAKGSFDMNKRSLIAMMLIGLLGFGMFVGCETGGGDDPADEPKVVAEKYRGTWVDEETPIGPPYIIAENSLTIALDIYDAWTEGNKLYYRNQGDHSRGGDWTFTDDTHFSYMGSTYTKQ